MIRIIVTGLVLGLVVQIVTTLSWLALPYHGASLNDFPHEQAEVVAFVDRFAEPGIYHYPGLATGMDEAVRLSQEGPVVTKIVVHPEGLDPLAPEKFGLSLLTNLLAGLVGACLFAQARSRALTLSRSVALGALFGAFAALTSVIPEALWWSYPLEFTTLSVIDLLVAWTIAGSVAHFLLRPSQPQPQGALACPTPSLS